MLKQLQQGIIENSLLSYGTWAYLGDARPEYKHTYLFWTSVDTNKVGVGKTIPVIISTDTGGFYISETITAERPANKNNSAYVAIADHIPNYTKFKEYTKGTKYETLEDAYAAYSELVDEKYSNYKDTLPK